MPSYAEIVSDSVDIHTDWMLIFFLYLMTNHATGKNPLQKLISEEQRIVMMVVLMHLQFTHVSATYTPPLLILAELAIVDNSVGVV